MYALSGRGLSVSRFLTDILQEPDPALCIIECAILLHDPELMKHSSWRKFAATFYHDCQSYILEYYGYTQAVLEAPKLEVTEKHLLLMTMAALYRVGTFSCTLEELATFIHSVFNLKLEQGSIHRMLYDELDTASEILRIFSDYKKNHI